MTHIPARHNVSPEIVNLADHEAHALQHLDANAWAYFSGGAADEITLRANRSAWDALPLWPRVLRPLAGGGVSHANEKSTLRSFSMREVLLK